VSDCEGKRSYCRLKHRQECNTKRILKVIWEGKTWSNLPVGSEQFYENYGSMVHELSVYSLRRVDALRGMNRYNYLERPAASTASTRSSYA
jgi:hypothetical protein